MHLNGNLDNQAIQEVITAHPAIGAILQKYDIGCVTCKVGICLLKDVVAIHGLAKQDETNIERDINDYLANRGTGTGEQ